MYAQEPVAGARRDRDERIGARTLVDSGSGSGDGGRAFLAAAPRGRAARCCLVGAALSGHLALPGHGRLPAPRIMPGDLLAALGDPESGLFFADEQAREAVLAHYGLDRPLSVQYADYVAGVVRGDLGWSISRNQPVSVLIAQHLPWTLLLMGSALALASVISFMSGVAAGWRRDGLRDRAGQQSEPRRDRWRL